MSSYEVVGDNIAHISMLDFNDLSRSQLDDAFDAVDINGTGGLIFDIRNNPGGTLASAIEIGSAFIEDGRPTAAGRARPERGGHTHKRGLR